MFAVTTQTSHNAAQTQLIEAAGVEFAYLRFGRSSHPPLVMLQHFRGNLDNRDSALTDALASEREVILVDYPGVWSSRGEFGCQQIAAIPSKRVPPPETRFVERDEIQQLLQGLPSRGRHALRDRALILFLYNTGARVEEVADLRVEHLDLDAHPTVRLHGKGDKWRTCPLCGGIELVLRNAFLALHLHRIEANIQPGNQASIALACGAGFSREGFRRDT
jgi:hypothetical protein